MEHELKKALDFLDNEAFWAGRRYPYHYIDYVDKTVKGNKQIFKFEIESDRDYKFFDVIIEVTDHEITHTSCNCREKYYGNVCKHVAASLLYYREEIFALTQEEKQMLYSKQLLEELYTEDKPKIKKQLNLEIEIHFIPANNEASLKLQIGENKLYNLNNKMNSFIAAFKNRNGKIVFGKDLTYDPDTHFFEERDEKIIRYIERNARDGYGNLGKNIFLNGEEVPNFLSILDGKKISLAINGEKFGFVNNIIEQNPFKMIVKKEGDLYTLSIDKDNKAALLMVDCSLAVQDDTIYIIPPKPRKVLSIMIQNDLDSIVSEEKDLDKFTKGILPVFKENLEVEDKLHDKIIVGVKPTAKIYLDMKGNIILCNPKFEYGGVEVLYTETNSNIIRDTEYEQEVIGYLLGLGFELNDKKIYMDNFEAMGNFLENDLEKLALKYEVFTSSKIKNTSFIKGNTVRSKFSIGKDNIMHYEFDLGNIKSDEIVNILNTIKNKKKYYRLKSGDFINVDENEDLKQLEALVDDMEISASDLVNGNGEIPKYRAIYLDSVKKDKYNIIETDNLFDDLIDKFNSYKDVKVKFSKSDKEILRDYQEVGVKWLYNIYKCGFGGILADEMGLGKSIQLIYLIKEVLKEKKDAKVLIVAPTALIYNWKNEFDKFGSDLKYKVFAENKEVRKHDLENLDNINVLITTYGLIRRDKDMYLDKNFEVIALDEAQNIKNNNAQMTKAVKSLHANTKLALTGTPLENSVLELWSIFDFIMPGYLANLLSFNRKYNIKDVDQDNLQMLDNLNKQIKPFILRRKKKDVVKELPEKLENNIFIDLSPEQKKVYVAELEKTQKELDEILASEGFKKGNFKILQLLMKLREVCIDPRLVYEDYKGGSAKIENLVSITKDIISNGHKILLFTSFKTALDIVNREFTNNNISTYVIDGSVPAKKRVELVDKFNSDDTNVFLITLKSGGTGLNLTSADVVIHLDLWWNPQVENQATDRAHRIGQTKTVEVIKLICNGTIEEKILDLQNKKKVLSDTLIEGDERDQNIISKLSEEDIKKLLSIDNNEEE